MEWTRNGKGWCGMGWGGTEWGGTEWLNGMETEIREWGGTNGIAPKKCK